MRVAAVARRTIKASALPGGLLTHRRRGDLIVLLYHRVGDGAGEIELPAYLFEHQLAYLREHDQVVTLDDALRDRDGGVVVTFDDGYADFYNIVTPLLVKHSIPATLFLATGLVGRAASGLGALTWADLKDIASTGVITVGSHTHTHADLSRAPQDVCEEEMRRSKDLIEDRLGCACSHFAYPWAVASPIADGVARLLFDSAAVGAWRSNRRGRIDPYRLGRTPVLRSDGGMFFRAKVRGLLDGEALFYRAARRGPWRRT
jgi:peptidoglycan/xylan/chitin deacetylase (PgdA/CDA1 family)